MIDSIKITSLNNIGSNLAANSVFPVVNLSGTPTTDKANLQIIGNAILSGAGGSSFVQAAQATLAQSVTNAAQPNITSVGTLTSLNMGGNLNISVGNLKITGGINGYVLQTDGAGNLNWTVQTGGGGNGAPGGANAQVQFNNAGSFGGEGNFTYDSGNHILNVTRANTSFLTAYESVSTANLSANGLATVARLNVTNTANLGAVANIIIIGGSNGQVLTTDGAGHLSWTAKGGGNANTGNITFNYATMASDSPNYDVLVKGYGTTANVNLESYHNVNITARVIPAEMTSVAVNSSGLFVAVGSRQGYPAYATSTDGINWTAAEPIPAPTTMYGIVITAITANSSGFFVAVGHEQYGYPVYTTSTDGTNWTTIAFITRSISFSPSSIAVNSNGRFTAVGSGPGYSPVYASSGDGVNWTSYGYMNGVTAFSLITSVTVNSAGLFVAVGYNGDLYPIYATAPDGYTWTTPATMNGSTTEAIMQSVTVNSVGLFVAVGRDTGQSAIYATSPDGSNWTTPAPMSGSPVSGFMTSVTVNSAGLFVAVGYDYNNNKHPLYATSANGSTWTAPALMNGSTINAYMSSVTVNSSGLFVAVGYDTYDNPLYAHSTNGSNWTTPAPTAFTQQVNINANEKSWTFASDGTLTAPGNVNMLGSRINIGPGSEVIPLIAPVLVATNSNAQFIQTVLVNADVTGSSDYAAQGPDSDDTQGYVDLGFAGSAFNDANFSITRPGDGYILAQGFSGGIGGNLVLSTGDKGTGQDIVFSMGGFLANNEFARMSLSNNAFELVQMNSAIQSRHSDALSIQTPTVSVSSNQAKWDYAVPTLQHAKGQWQGTGTSADGVTLYTLQSDIDPTVALFYTDYLHTTPYTLPAQLFGAVGDFLYGTKANDLYIKGGPAVSTTRGLGGDIILSASDGVETQWRFTTHGELFAPGNAYLSGNLITIGPDANIFANSLQNATLVISDGDSAYVQAAITNASDSGSADWVAYGHHGNTDSGWIDTGFTSAGYNDPTFTITAGGDGYIFVEGYQLGQAPFQGGGNLVLATGSFGANRDILFATNGFSTTNLFGKISDANNALELSRAGSNLNFTGGGGIIGAGNLKLQPNANVGGAYLDVYLTTGPDIHIASNNENLILGRDEASKVTVAANNSVIITGDDGNPHNWVFNSDGSVTFPNQSTNQRTGTGEALMFAKTGTQKIIGTKAGTVSIPVVERLVIAGGDGYDTGEGGDIYLWAGRSGANGGTGGDIKVDGGDGYNGSEGGTIKIRGGYSQSGTAGPAIGGFIEIYAGGGNIGAPVDIRSGQGNSQANSGNITLSTPYGGTWTFGTDGTLTLPDGSIVANGFISGTSNSAGGITSGGNGYQQFFAQSDGAYVQTSANNAGTTFNSWTFGLDGALNLPNHIDTLGAVVQSTFPIRVISSGKYWNFDTSGNLTTPGSIITSGSAGNITGANVISAITYQSSVVAFSALPAPTTAGLKAFINDANLVAAGNFGAAVNSGGSNVVPVYSDGSDWRIG